MWHVLCKGHASYKTTTLTCIKSFILSAAKFASKAGLSSSSNSWKNKRKRKFTVKIKPHAKLTCSKMFLLDNNYLRTTQVLHDIGSLSSIFLDVIKCQSNHVHLHMDTFHWNCRNHFFPQWYTLQKIKLSYLAQVSLKSAFFKNLNWIAGTMNENGWRMGEMTYHFWTKWFG